MGAREGIRRYSKGVCEGRYSLKRREGFNREVNIGLGLNLKINTSAPSLFNIIYNLALYYYTPIHSLIHSSFHPFFTSSIHPSFPLLFILSSFIHQVIHHRSLFILHSYFLIHLLSFLSFIYSFFLNSFFFFWFINLNSEPSLIHSLIQPFFINHSSFLLCSIIYSRHTFFSCLPVLIHAFIRYSFFINSFMHSSLFILHFCILSFKLSILVFTFKVFYFFFYPPVFQYILIIPFTVSHLMYLFSLSWKL